MKPVTQYTKSGRINIAYQVFGSGGIDLVYIPGWVSNIDWMWSCPELVDFLLELGKIARVVLFDKRGTGLSDRVVELSTLEERMDDIRAVMDAAGSEKAVLFGHSEGGSVSALFAATYPNRVVSLITFGIFARRIRSPEYPWAPTMAEREKVYEMIENHWGSGQMELASLAPSKAHDGKFMEWLANYFRSGASPSAALVLTKMNTQVDIIDILESIKVPTLIIQRTGDIDVKIEEGHFIASRIKDSKFVALEGRDHLFWAGNTQAVLREMKHFILKDRPNVNHEVRLFTVLSAKIIAQGGYRSGLEELLDRSVSQYRGNIALYDTPTLIATFEGPSKAVHCAIDLVASVRQFGVKLAIAIHIRELEVEKAHLIDAETSAFVRTLLEKSRSDQVLITQTIRNLLSGAGLDFKADETFNDPISGESILLFSVTDRLRSGDLSNSPPSYPLRQNDSFLENILQRIDEHLDDETFGVQSLCQEMGTSERQLQRKLKAVANKSPNQLISSVRLHRAKEILLEREKNIAEIAYRTGFSSPSYFSRCFKKEFGTSPSTLLQQLH